MTDTPTPHRNLREYFRDIPTPSWWRESHPEDEESAPNPQFMHELAKPFFFEGSRDEACLITHGYTGSPAHMRLLGQTLHDQGYTVRGVRLSGHGTRWQDMEQSTWQDWLHDVRMGLRDLQAHYPRVHLLGLSMGAILSLITASQYPVSSVTSIAAPIILPSRLPYLAPIAKYIIRYRPWEPQDALPGSAEDHYINYDGVPTKTSTSLLRLMYMARRNLHRITAPLLVVQSRSDETVKPMSATIIYANTNSTIKDALWLTHSRHVSTLGPEREQLHQKVIQFLDKVRQQDQYSHPV